MRTWLGRSLSMIGLITAGACSQGRKVEPPTAHGNEVLGSPKTRVPDDTGTVVLFDGTSWNSWVTREGEDSPWAIQPDGSVVAGDSDAVSAQSFGDFQLHVEFMCPPMPGEQGQARANSGVYLQGRYEVQVLDSYGQEPALNGCGAVYSIAPPLVNASLPPGQWQTYDITFRAPRYDESGELLEHARVTVVHNGTVIHDDLELPGETPGGIKGGPAATGPILLQYHGDPVRYRNIRVRPLD